MKEPIKHMISIKCRNDYIGKKEDPDLNRMYGDTYRQMVTVSNGGIDYSRPPRHAERVIPNSRTEILCLDKEGLPEKFEKKIWDAIDEFKKEHGV